MQIAALFRLDGRTAIVTGGASRFGSPISRALAQAGANVMIASRRLQPCEELPVPKSSGELTFWSITP